MKNTNKNSHGNDIVTKSYFEEKLDERLKKEFQSHSDKMNKYIDFKLEPINEFMRKFDRFHEDIMTKLDWLITKYQKFEQEYLVQSQINQRVLERLESHENSIIHLKKITSNLQS